VITFHTVISRGVYVTWAGYIRGFPLLGADLHDQVGVLDKGGGLGKLLVGDSLGLELI
jgi:hypothetical protein